MHILLGILGPLVTILILLNRLAQAGIDLRGLNPFLWQRRRKWRKQYEGNPLFQIEAPIDAVGILMVGVAKADGDISAEEKKLIQQLFESELKLGAKDAAGLFISSAHLIGDGIQLRDNVGRFLKTVKNEFSDAQAHSAIRLLHDVASLGGSNHPNVDEFLLAVKQELLPSKDKRLEWQG